MRYKLFALYGSLVALAVCTSYAILRLTPQSPEALPLTQCQSDELYPDLTDCSKFYSCSPDGPELFQCTLGFHFNPTKLACDWANDAGCVHNDDASTTILFVEATYADEMAIGSQEVSVAEFDNGPIISSTLDIKSTPFETSSNITSDTHNILLNITSNVEETTHSNNTDPKTDKLSQFPSVNPEVTLNVSKETYSNPILTSVSSFLVNDQGIQTEISNEVDFNSNDSLSSSKLDISSDYTKKIGRNGSTEVTKDFTHEHELSSTNSEGNVNKNHLNSDRNSTIIYGDIIENTQLFGEDQFSNDVPEFEQDTYINSTSKNDDKSKLEINVTVPADSIKVALQNASKDNKYTTYLRNEDDIISTEGNFKSDMVVENNPSQRITEKIFSVTPTETNNDTGYSYIDESHLNFLNEVGKFQTTQHNNNNISSAVKPLVDNIGRLPSENSFNDLHSTDRKSDSVTATDYATKDSKISSSYEGDEEITNVSSNNINDVDTNAVSKQAVESSTNSNDSFYVSGKNKLLTFAIENVINTKDVWKEANSTFLPVTSSDDKEEERIITTTTNIHVNISASNQEELTSAYLNISAHTDGNNDIAYDVDSSKTKGDKTIPYLSNNEDIYSELEKYSNYRRTSPVSQTEVIDGINFVTGNRFEYNNFYDNDDDRVTSSKISLNEQEEPYKSTTIKNKSIIDNPMSIDLAKKDDDMDNAFDKRLKNEYNVTISLVQNAEDNNTSLEADYNKEVATEVSDRKIDEDPTSKIMDRYETNNQSTQQMVLNATVINIPVLIKNNSNFEINNFSSAVLELGEKTEDNFYNRQYSETSEAITEFLDATSEKNLNIVEDMSTMKPNEMNSVSTDIKSETTFSSTYQENFSESLNSPPDLTYDNLDYRVESEEDKYKTDKSFDNTNIDIDLNIAELVEEVTDIDLDNINQEETYSSKGERITNDSRPADSDIFLTTISTIQEDNKAYDESLSSTYEYVDNFKLYTEEGSKHLESKLITSESSSNKGSGINDYDPYVEKDKIQLSTESNLITDNTSLDTIEIFNTIESLHKEKSNIPDENTKISDKATSETYIIANVTSSTENPTVINGVGREVSMKSEIIIRNKTLPTNITHKLHVTKSSQDHSIYTDVNKSHLDEVSLLGDVDSKNINSDKIHLVTNDNLSSNEFSEDYDITDRSVTSDLNYVKSDNMNITMHSSRNDTIVSEHTQEVISEGSKSTNNLEKDENTLVVTSPHENKLKNDLSTDVAQRLKNKIIFSSTSKTNKNEPSAFLETATNLSISIKQITNMTVNNNQLPQMQNAVVAPLENIKVETIYTTNLLKMFTKVGNTSFSDKYNETINYIEQIESINKETEKSSTSIPNISNQTVSYTHIALNYFISHIVRQQEYLNSTKYVNSYIEDKVNSMRIKLMQIISNISNDPMMINDTYTSKKYSMNENKNDKNNKNAIGIKIHNYVGDKRETNEDNTNEGNMNKEDTNKDNAEKENSASKEDGMVRDKRKKNNRKKTNMVEDNTNINTVEDTAIIEKNENLNKKRYTAKVFKDQYKLTDNMSGDKTNEQNNKNKIIKNKSNRNGRQKHNTKENGMNENSTEEDSTDEDSTDEDSTEEDSTDEDSTDEDNTDEDSTEEDSTDENSTVEDSTQEDSTDEDSTEEDSADEDSTDEDSTEEDNTKKHRDISRYIKNGKNKTVGDVENHQLSEDNTIEGNVSKGDSDSYMAELSAIEELINKTNAELNKEKYYIRHLLQAENSTGTNYNDYYTRPYSGDNESKYEIDKNRKQSIEKKIGRRNRQHKYRGKSKQDVEKTQENQSRNKNKSNTGNRTWRTITNKEQNKVSNRKHKRKHAFVLNIKKVIFEKSLKDINWEL